MAIDYSNLGNYSSDELEKELIVNQNQWWSEDDGSGIQKTEGQKQANNNNQLIHQELDKRNNTQTTFNAATGTYDTKGNQALDTTNSQSLYDSTTNAYSSNLANKPVDNSVQYNAKFDDLYNQIVNRGKFSYDLNADELYNQYKDQYMRNGKLAMEDTIGQAAGLTGGYGSTYGQMAGQQAYNSYLQDLNNIVPQLEQRAYDRWRDEGNDLLTQWGLVDQRFNEEYGKYQDALSDYWTGNSFLANRADQYYNQVQNEKAQLADNAQFLYNNGYELTDEQGAALGFSPEQTKTHNDGLNATANDTGYYYRYTPGDGEGDDTPGLVKGNGITTEQSVIDSIQYADRMIQDESAKKSAISKIIYNSVGLDRMTPEDADKYLADYDISDEFYETHKK